MTDSCILILYPTSLPRSPISCNSSPILGGLCFKIGAICSLMAEGANDAGGQGERTVTGVGLSSSERGRGPRAKQDWCPYISHLWAFPSSHIFFSVKWQEGWSIGIGFEYSRRPQRVTWTGAHETRVVTAALRPSGGWRSYVGDKAHPQGYVPPACFAAPRWQAGQQLVLSRVGFLAGGREGHEQCRYFQKGHDRDES